jgi:DNA-directed RNA polymerase subunit RPC12/RpoP
MNYRCPSCKNRLNLSKLFFSDISACKTCSQKVVLGDFLAFFLASVSMMVMALSSLYLLTHRVDDNIVAGGYALTIGMATGIVILLLLGRATPYRSYRNKSANRTAVTGSAPLSSENSPKPGKS